MQPLQLMHIRTTRRLQVNLTKAPYPNAKPQNGNRRLVEEFPMLSTSGIEWDDVRLPSRTGEFFKDLSIEAKSDFELLARRFHCPGATVLIWEEQRPSSILVLLDGKVKISMNSFDGKRFLLGVAGAGDILGLNSVISGNPSEIRAESMYPCTIASLHRQDLLNFLRRYPIAFQNVATELSSHYTRACERLRMFGLTSSVKSRVAALLLEWCRGARRTRCGTQIWCVLTHQEIGEYIGASRETVTRILSDLKNRGLMELRGTILIIPSRSALMRYAGLGSISNPGAPPPEGI
jgi:CRP/FNR family cyclic AMP-dependent transcriptional regulator